jgi:hypothetical protein
LSASRVDDETLMARATGADVGEIDPRPAHKRRCRKKYPCASRLRSILLGNGAPHGDIHWAAAVGTKAMGMSAPNAEPAKHRPSASFNLIVMLIAPRIALGDPGAPNAARLRRRRGRVRNVSANAHEPINFS